jgi:histone H3/H4
LFAERANTWLPDFLRNLCDDKKQWRGKSPWYCRRLFSVLLEAIDAHASRQEAQLARTQLVAVLFEKLDFAWSEKRFIKFEGQSRGGKTEAVRAYAAMYPGRVRLFACPPGYCSRDLFAAMAESFGIYFTPETPTRKLKDMVEFVLRHSGLMLIADEAHFLLPPPTSTVSAPARLDWFRTHAVDRKRPVALITTPQAFNRAVDKFRRHADYNFDQLFGRIDLNVSLPDELGNEDLLEVVRAHGPDFPEQAQRLIALRVAQAETYLSKIEAVCCLAKFIARNAGRATVTDLDVELALSEVISTAAAPARPSPLPAGRASQTVIARQGRLAAVPVLDTLAPQTTLTNQLQST